MDELVKLVAEKVNIPEEQARTAVNLVVGFLKEKLPKPVAGQIDAFLGGGSDAVDKAEGVVKGLGGLFGKK